MDSSSGQAGGGLQHRRCPVCDVEVAPEVTRCLECGANVDLPRREARAELISKARSEQQSADYRVRSGREFRAWVVIASILVAVCVLALFLFFVIMMILFPPP